MVNLVELATRVKSARKERGYTLDELAKRADIGKGMLSKVENFRVTPSLPTIIKVAAALEIPLEKLFEGLDKKTEAKVVRKGESKAVDRDSEHSSIAYFDLAHPRPNRKMDPFELSIPPGGGREQPMSHEGEEFLRVLEGTVHLRIDEREHEMHAGDSIYFDAEVPHCLQNPTEEEARVLCVFLERS
ncbi:helix-turn-helix domain-containing protein [Rubritalea tangerina]|uniref:Helix-turn-helix domain-containing protein n=1 Tax=Rubritalea tangerina TaxID=430798 RepID=A0ABW4ZAZ6_9BACT